MKTFHIQHDIGRAKHVVNHHNGTKKHDDGSRFFEIAIFKNKTKLAKFTKDLKANGYKQKPH